MKSLAPLATLALSLLLLSGCGGPAATESSNTPEPKPSTESETRIADIPPVDAEPNVVVSTFLASLREGNDLTASALLTDVARDETARANLEVKPPGSPSAQYQVGGVSYVTGNKERAHVSSVWTDTYEDGVTETYNVTWVLRHQPNGWRIAGLATKPQPNAPEMFLNFENPEEMLARVQQAEGQPTTETAANPNGVRQARNPNGNAQQGVTPR